MNDTNASSSLYGWDFQVNAALLMMLRDLQNIECLRVEGDEDIEIHYSNNTIDYAQAKARSTSNPGDNSTRRFKNAIHTIASSLKKDKCARATFVTNDSLPFGKTHSEINYGDYTYLTFSELPVEQREYILAAFKAAGIEEEVIERLSEKFAVFVFWYYGNDKTTRLRVVNSEIEKFLSEIGANKIVRKAGLIHDIWFTSLLVNGSTREKEITVSKSSFIWPLIVVLCEATLDDKYFEETYEDLAALTLDLYSEIINESVDSFNVVTTIISDYENFLNTHITTSRNESIEAFSNEMMEEYKSFLYTNNLDPELEETVIKLIVQKVITQRLTISKIRSSVGLAY